MHNSIINQCRHSVKDRLNVSWSHFHSKSGNIKGQFLEGCGFAPVCVCVFVWWSNDDLDLESCVIRYYSCTSLQGGCINSLWEIWQRGVTQWLHLPSFSLWRVCHTSHASMHSIYLGPAFEMFVLRVTRLPQSWRSAPLYPQMLSPLYISASFSGSLSTCCSLSCPHSSTFSQSSQVSILLQQCHFFTLSFFSFLFFFTLNQAMST